MASVEPGSGERGPRRRVPLGLPVSGVFRARHRARGGAGGVSTAEGTLLTLQVRGRLGDGAQ
jgi:hypothetical protein